MKLSFAPLAAAGLALTLATGAVAQTILYEANFNADGNIEGFVNFQDRLDSYNAAGGSLVGTGGTNNDPQIRTAAGTLAVDLGALTDATLEIRAKNSDGSIMSGGLSYIEFVGAAAGNTVGLPKSNFTFTPAAADTFEVFTFDAKAILAAVVDEGANANDNILRSIRIDPLNNPPAAVSGKTFEIDYVRITSTVPEPASLALLGLGGLAMMGRRRK